MRQMVPQTSAHPYRIDSHVPWWLVHRLPSGEHLKVGLFHFNVKQTKGVKA